MSGSKDRSVGFVCHGVPFFTRLSLENTNTAEEPLVDFRRRSSQTVHHDGPFVTTLRVRANNTVPERILPSSPSVESHYKLYFVFSQYLLGPTTLFDLRDPGRPQTRHRSQDLSVLESLPSPN